MSSLFTSSAPRWFSIPAHRPFVQDLAQGLYDALAPLGPESLSQAVILTPTRRGARSLADAFIAAAGGAAVLPPQIRPLGDLDEGEPTPRRRWNWPTPWAASSTVCRSRRSPATDSPTW